MQRRFFVNQPITGQIAYLEEHESRHLARVLRLSEGDDVTLFDGSGYEFAARIVRIERRRVELRVLERRVVSRELRRDLTLSVALPKGERQRWLIEKAVELGVTRFVPLVAERGVARPRDQALVRLRRTVVEASKQCGRNRLLEIARPQTLRELDAALPANHLRLIADPSGDTSPLEILQQADNQSHICAVVGPEGGFTDDELAIVHGWQRVDLGERILRVETAAIAIAAWFSLSDG